MWIVLGVLLQGRLRTLVQLLTGFYRSDYGAARFNMLVDVFNETGVQSGEAERVLVNIRSMMKISPIYLSGWASIFFTISGTDNRGYYLRTGPLTRVLIRTEKMGRHFPDREKSGNFWQTGKVREFQTNVVPYFLVKFGWKVYYFLKWIKF